MTVRIAKPSVNIREKLAELERPIGLNGQALLATSTPQEAFDLLGAGRTNLLINGDFKISQRGTTFSNPGTQPPTYTLDRFFCQASTNNQTITQDTDVPTGFNRSLKLTMGTATTLDYMRVGTTIEGFNFSNLSFGTSSAKPFTISFWVKSSLTGNFGIGFRNSDSSGNNLTISRLASYTINSANTWEYKTITIPGATSQTWNITNGSAITILWDIGDSAARSATVDTTWQTSNGYYSVGLTGGTKVANTTGATWYITGVQLEAGKVATPFEYRSIGEKLALCQRYYQEIGNGNNGSNEIVEGGYGTTAMGVYNSIQLPVEMRTVPTLSQVGTLYTINVSQPGSLSGHVGRKSFSIANTVTSAGTWVYATSTSAYFTLSAEL